MRRMPLLVGERVKLRPLADDDAFGPYPDWLNDAEVCRGNSHHVFPFTEAGALRYIRAAATDESAVILAIVTLADDRHIGNIALERLHRIHRSAELAILIGERDAWGKGYGNEAAALICEYGFGVLGLERIACGTFVGNLAMQRLALGLGMREEGRRRQAAFKEGAFVDVIEYGVLRTEYPRAIAGTPGT